MLLAFNTQILKVLMTSLALDKLRKIASRQSTRAAAEPEEKLINHSLCYLVSSEALESIESDAYWPKWNSPWWHMLLLHEMGLTSCIPGNVVESIVAALNKDYLRFFPLSEAETPVGVDPINQVACHCQLGTMHQLLSSYGIDVDSRLAWLRPWYLRCQLSDGGLNCDETAYRKSVEKSSVVSTLPPMEAVLSSASGIITPAEIDFLDSGASYLIKKRLFRTASTGQPIDNSWLKLCFPRFYHYDVLRGLSFLLNWSGQLRRSLPIAAIQECVESIDNDFPDGCVSVQRSVWEGANSRYFDKTTRLWTNAPAVGYPLLKAVSKVGNESIFLTRLWSQARANLLFLIEEGLIETETSVAL